MKTAKKALALFLTLVMCLSLVPAAAFADKPVYKVVAVGDSTCVGLGLNDYGVYSITDHIIKTATSHTGCSSALNFGFWTYGSEKAYPALLADYLAEKMPEYNVKFSNLGISGIRANEILCLINGETETDYAGQGMLDKCYDWIDVWAGRPKTGIRITPLFNREIKSADLITLDCAMNSFTGVLTGRLLDILYNDLESLAEYGDLKYSHEDFLRILAPVADELSEENVLGAVEKLGGLMSNISGAITPVDIIEECFCDFCVNFSKLVQKLRELNPTAKILVCGTYNPFYDLSMEFNGVEFDFGSLVSSYLGLADLYMSKLAAERDEYLFVDLPDNVETIREVMAKAGDVWGVSPVFLSRLIDSMYSEYPEQVALPLLEKVRIEADARGVDLKGYVSHFTSKYSDSDLILPSVVDAAFADVRENGDAAEAANRVIVDVYSRYFNLIIGCMDLKKLDAVGWLLSKDIGCHELLYSLMDKSPDELTDTEKTELFCVCNEKLREGMGAHFSEDGCRLKFELARDVLEADAEDSGVSDRIIGEIKTEAKQSVDNSIQGSLVGILKNVLAKIDVTAFFANISQDIRQFFVKLVPTC